VPFDERRGVIPNDTGRVLNEEGNVQDGLYVAGWIKRGPSGVIGTNKADALETVRALLEDVRASKKDVASVLQLLAERDVVHIDFDEWLALDAAEQAAGAAQDRPRVKVTSRDAMLRAAKGGA
jgi:ferredoxin--NADP+ reductase